MRRTIGRDNAQTRRRTRRAASRRTELGRLSEADVLDIQNLVSAASGSTGLPLSDRGVSWDSGAAAKAVKNWAGADDAPNAKYASAFMVKQNDGSNFGDYKLPFANVMDGKLTAVWRAITAIAAVLQGSRGGANITDAEASAAKSKVESYYAKARKQYGDDSITVPWGGDGSQSAAEMLAYAMFPDVESEEFAAAVIEWQEILFTLDGLTDAELADEIRVLIPEEMGGKPNPGTKPDKRLKDNKKMEDEQQPEESALDAIEAYAAAVKCSCGHAYSEHSGAGGTCGHEDGRGTCRCGEFAYPDNEPEVTTLAAAIVGVRPDLAGFEVEIETIARRALLAVTAAAGDVVWGPEEGFQDLICDLNALLHPNEGDDSYWPAVYDVSVKLDKVLICDDWDYYIAPLTIGGDGEPILADRSDWISVEDAGYVEATMAKISKLHTAAPDHELTADGAAAPAIPAEHEPAEVLPEASTPSPEAPPTEIEGGGQVKWTATFVPEGVLTEDGRAFAPGSIILPPDEKARQLPLTLMAMIETSAEGGHDGAEVAGRIDNLWREGDLVKASGTFSTDEYGQKIAHLVKEQSLTGLSVDIAPLAWEHVAKAQWFDDDGKWIAVQNDETGEWAPAEGSSERSDEETLADWLNGDLVLAITSAVIGMATVCPFPAFGGASIALTASGIPRLLLTFADFQIEVSETEPEPEAISLSASAAGLAPVAPPAEWFENPGFEELTPLTITDDGRIYGHAWQWETCHLSFNECVVAPHSITEYAYYMLGELECEDGEKLNVGKITFDTSHAGTRLSRAEATAHYDQTGTVAAHVQFGEDEFGGWFAGAIDPDLTERDLRKIRGSTVSGDWRGVDGNLELVALLAVNVPGFPVPRQRAGLTASGEEAEIVSLTAAGILYFEDDIRQLVACAVSPEPEAEPEPEE